MFSDYYLYLIQLVTIFSPVISYGVKDWLSAICVGVGVSRSYIAGSVHVDE